MVLELISRLEIDRSAVRESESDDEDGTATTTNNTASSNVLKINVKEERDCDNVPLRTGLRVWSATFIFGENVLRSEIENKKVLELGSGTGVNGLICAKLNASSVMCTDVDIKSVNLCVANAMLNKEFDVVSRVLDWGDANTYFQGESFPVIVAVDVVYLEEHAKELANCVAHHLCKENGTFLCVCGVRKREYFETFLRELAERDMEVYFDEVGLMPKSNREQVEEIRSNHKHDEELLEDGKGYRMIRARFKKVIGREAERNEEEGESEALAGFLDDLDMNGAGRMKRQQAYDMSSSTSDDDDDEEEEHDSSGKKVESVPFLCSTVASASHSLLRNGFCVFRDEGFAQTQTEILEHVHSCCQSYLNDLLERCKTKHGINYETDIFRFKEICSRAVNGKRFDFQATKLSDSDDVKKLPESGKAFAEVLQTLANIVEQKCEKIFETVTKGGEKKMEEEITIVNRGCVTSLPKAPEQHFHADGRKEGMYNCFVALHDVPKIQGPTEFIFGSHKFDHDAPYVDTKTRKRQEKAKRIAPELRKGDILLYDYRTLHRGGENKRCHDRRAISYFLFDTKSGSGDTWNFEDVSVWDD